MPPVFILYRQLLWPPSRLARACFAEDLINRLKPRSCLPQRSRLIEDLLRLPLHPPRQLLTARHIMDQPHYIRPDSKRQHQHPRFHTPPSLASQTLNAPHPRTLHPSSCSLSGKLPYSPYSDATAVVFLNFLSTSTVSFSVASQIALFTFSCIGASTVAIHRVPMFTPHAPSASAAASCRPFAKPPLAQVGDLELFGA